MTSKSECCEIFRPRRKRGDADGVCSMFAASACADKIGVVLTGSVSDLH